MDKRTQLVGALLCAAAIAWTGAAIAAPGSAQSTQSTQSAQSPKDQAIGKSLSPRSVLSPERIDELNRDAILCEGPLWSRLYMLLSGGHNDSVSQEEQHKLESISKDLTAWMQRFEEAPAANLYPGLAFGHEMRAAIKTRVHGVDFELLSVNRDEGYPLGFTSYTPMATLDQMRQLLQAQGATLVRSSTHRLVKDQGEELVGERIDGDAHWLYRVYKGDAFHPKVGKQMSSHGVGYTLSCRVLPASTENAAPKSK